MPAIRLDSRFPHPLVDSDQFLHVDGLLSKDERPCMTSVLEAIQLAFTDRTLRGLLAEDCVNISVKLQ